VTRDDGAVIAMVTTTTTTTTTTTNTMTREMSEGDPKVTRR
jgi:hypothetical protein